MVFEKSDAVSQILATQQEGLLTQCFVLLVSLAVINVMSTVGEITVLAEFSPKEYTELIKNIEEVEENETSRNKAEFLDKLCATH